MWLAIIGIVVRVLYCTPMVEVPVCGGLFGYRWHMALICIMESDWVVIVVTLFVLLCSPPPPPLSLHLPPLSRLHCPHSKIAVGRGCRYGYIMNLNNNELSRT